MPWAALFSTSPNMAKFPYHLVPVHVSLPHSRDELCHLITHFWTGCHSPVLPVHSTESWNCQTSRKQSPTYFRSGQGSLPLSSIICWIFQKKLDPYEPNSSNTHLTWARVWHKRAEGCGKASSPSLGNRVQPPRPRG